MTDAASPLDPRIEAATKAMLAAEWGDQLWTTRTASSRRTVGGDCATAADTASAEPVPDLMAALRASVDAARTRRVGTEQGTS